MPNSASRINAFLASISANDIDDISQTTILSRLDTTPRLLPIRARVTLTTGACGYRGCVVTAETLPGSDEIALTLDNGTIIAFLRDLDVYLEMLADGSLTIV